MLEIRTVDHAESTAFRYSLSTTFGIDFDADTTGDERFQALIAPGRAWCATDGGEIVATAATFALDVRVPGGGALPMAGLTQVTVRPTHRRRGILTSLVARHLDDARDRGEPISGLWASEGAIYGRFGYGLAAVCDELAFDARHLNLRVPEALGACDEPVMIDEATARVRLPPIFARATAARPGTLVRSPDWWQHRRFLESTKVRAGATKRRHVVVRRGGEDVGYIAYRQKMSAAGPFDPNHASSTQIVELIAVDARAEASLWRFASGVDLFPLVSWWNAPIDCALPWLVADWRRISRKRADTLWLRVADVPATLAARRYATDGALRFSSAGQTWALEIANGHAQCAPTSGDAELALDPDALGAVFLGGVTFDVLARAGRVRGSAEAIGRADRLFGWPIAPWCPEVF